MSLVAHPQMVVDKEEMKRLVERREAILLDARASERFEGKLEPVDSRPGHVPGRRARRSRTTCARREEPSFARRARANWYAALGVDDIIPVVAYCGSSVTACHDLLALTLAGHDHARLYEGSWSEWSADSALEAALGKA